MDYRAVMHAHMMWSAGLWDRIEAGEAIDAEEIGRDDRCEIGRWLHGQGKAYQWLGDFQRFKDLHAAFHRCAREAVLEARNGDKEEGLRKLDGDGACGDITKELLDVSYDVFDVVERLEDS